VASANVARYRNTSDPDFIRHVLEKHSKLEDLGMQFLRGADRKHGERILGILKADGERRLAELEGRSTDSRSDSAVTQFRRGNEWSSTAVLRSRPNDHSAPNRTGVSSSYFASGGSRVSMMTHGGTVIIGTNIRMSTTEDVTEWSYDPPSFEVTDGGAYDGTFGPNGDMTWNRRGQ
jgi:hypothetical protein